MGIVIVAEPIDAGPAGNGPVDGIINAYGAQIFDDRAVDLFAQPIDRFVVHVEQVRRQIIGGQIFVGAVQFPHQFD